ncbi:PREDICTED: LEAF RUST 10 DISEASE-RESISTANCE LOCUS RECEPTOR-LIKE PROTEIN KINASE-like 1.3 [Tarenaya hassleriana]|uniref:LEAF RUST 10 DISEASE-RESISTANCE LOCUS RECEPTOR-LIKE PROTEIN KINASE-like 1.3 n=1 Tax=Tarenaya hassleriana TaxID=28532 RepID=UPI0008FD24A0|nr:PREDICTED: LEAF RUST 10 DISEASE-RESISTANCE LOCUS RECEPTOR-LIKE PROTEIN KINASE-like 1.3 [Tarenaya hassleriana]
MDSPASVEFSKPRFCLAFFLLFLFLNLPCALSNRKTGLCDRLFECGNITAGFPFWGGNRYFHCGHPLLRLGCKNESNTTFLEFSGVLYDVLDIDLSSKTLELVREEFTSGSTLCQLLYDTLPPQLFEHSPPYKNLTIFHHCDRRFHYLENFTCPWSDLGTVYQDTEYSTRCREIANVAVPASFLADRGSWSFSLLESVLKEGFQVKLKLKFDEKACQKCSSSGGTCNFGSDGGVQVCCRNSSLGFRCNPTGSDEGEFLIMFAVLFP